MENEIENKDAIVTPAVVETDLLTEANAKIAKLENERDNYKDVALRRLGKLPGDAEFLGGTENGELSVAEQVRLALLDKEIELEKKAKEDSFKKILRERDEALLALKNRPQGSIGGDSGASTEVKDNIFSEAQLDNLRKRAIALKADPEKFIQTAKDNLLKQR